MIFGPIRAVAIDDEPSHLLAITTGLTGIGIPCIGYWYDRDLNELRPAPPDGGLPFLRIVFMDLNLAEQAGIPEASTLASGVMDVLRQIIAPRGGPYLLVFWTQVGARVEEVAELVRERVEDVAGVPCPLAITSLPKGPFIVADPADDKFKVALRAFHSTLHDNMKALQDAVRDAAAYDVQLSALSFWESRASEAAARAVNQVFECVKNQAPVPANRAEMTQKVLATIAIGSAGRKLAAAQPARALDAGMLDMLVDQFEASVAAPDYAAAIARAIGDAVKGNPDFPDQTRLYADLNTVFHVDTDCEDASAIDRGVVLSIDAPFNRGLLGVKPNNLLTSEFLFPHELFPEERHEEIQALLRDCRQSAETVLVEVGADCDHAQATDRTRRYLIGLEVPAKHLELTAFHRDGKLRNEALLLLGPWWIGAEAKYLLVSCRRFWVWQAKEPPPANVKYRLRASVVDKLLHHYTSWGGRPGIVEFRSEG